MKKLRMYFLILGTKPYRKEVSSAEEARIMIDAISSFVNAKVDEGVFPDHCSTAGLEEYDEEEKDWVTWYDENEILDVVHKTICQFFDVCGDDEEVPMSDKDKLLLEVNKAICDNLKALEQEPFINKACVSNKVCEHDKKVALDKIRAEIKQLRNFRAENYDLEKYCDYFDARIIFRDDVLQIIDKYREESEET